jgi:hypothetical protein
MLVYLATHDNRYVSCEELIRMAWPVNHIGDQAVHNAVSKLRNALNDDPSDPRYITSERLRGYRVIVPVKAIAPATEQAVEQSPLRRRRRRRFILLVAVVLLLLLLYPRQESVWQVLQRFLGENPGNWVIEVKPASEGGSDQNLPGLTRQDPAQTTASPVPAPRRVRRNST